jgi:DNA-directed RNA polymerase sigma subunit (sigma70/sigma32)
MADDRRPRRPPAGGGDDRAPRLPPELRRALATMPETQRRVLELRMGLADGHPHDAADAARAIGVSVGELREIEARAFERLRSVLPREHLERLLKGD